MIWVTIRTYKGGSAEFPLCSSWNAQCEAEGASKDAGELLCLDTKYYPILVSSRMKCHPILSLPDQTCANKITERKGKKNHTEICELCWEWVNPWNPAGAQAALLMELSGFHPNSRDSYSLLAEGRCGFTGNTGPCSLWVFKAWAIILNWKQRWWSCYRIV